MGVRRGSNRRRLYSLNKLGQAATSFSGTGISPTIVSSTLLRQGSEVVTEIVLDLGSSLTGSLEAVKTIATDGLVIGVSSSSGTHGPANLTTLATATNGHLIAIDMICLETPSGSAAVSTDIDLVAHATSTLTYGGNVATGSSGTILINASGSWTQGSFKSWTTLPGSNIYALNASGNVPGDTVTLYLAHGGSGAAGSYSAGKYVIRLYGIVEANDL